MMFVYLLYKYERVRAEKYSFWKFESDIYKENRMQGKEFLYLDMYFM